MELFDKKRDRKQKHILPLRVVQHSTHRFIANIHIILNSMDRNFPNGKVEIEKNDSREKSAKYAYSQCPKNTVSPATPPARSVSWPSRLLKKMKNRKTRKISKNTYSPVTVIVILLLMTGEDGVETFTTRSYSPNSSAFQTPETTPDGEI